MIGFGDVFRMTSWTHHEPLMRVGLKVPDKTKVVVMLMLGHEKKDGTEPLNLDKAMNDLGWFRRDDGTERTA